MTGGSEFGRLKNVLVRPAARGGTSWEDPRDGAAGARCGGPAQPSTGQVVAISLPGVHGEVMVGEAAVAAAVEGHSEGADVRVLSEDPPERLELVVRGVADWFPAAAASPPGPIGRVVVLPASRRGEAPGPSHRAEMWAAMTMGP